MDTTKTIATLVQDGLGKLTPHLREWVEQHLIVPEKRTFTVDPGGTETAELWLVTGHTGNKDSSFRVVFDDQENRFGLATTLEDGTHWYMGLNGSFDEAIESM